MEAANLQREREKLLDEWARITVTRLIKGIMRQKVGRTHALRYSLRHDVIKAAGGDMLAAEHAFNYYGKFVDMGVGRGQALGDVRGGQAVAAATGLGRRPKRWFSKRYYAETVVIGKLMSEKFGEQGTREIIETLNDF